MPTDTRPKTPAMTTPWWASDTAHRHHHVDVYRHPRTVLKAFGLDANTANPIQRYKPTRLDKLAAIAIGIGFAALLFFQLSK